MFYYILIGIIIAAAVAFAIIKAKRNTPEGKGVQGEKQVASVLNSLGGTVINNYMLIGEDGKSHQIDHLFVSRRGAFVVETKNYGGSIYGTAEQREWTQSMQYGRVKNRFYSPVKQNNSHMYHISKILPRSTPIYSCVVFPRADISNVVADNVFDLRGLRNFIAGQREALTDEQVDRVLAALEAHKSETVTAAEHIDEIRQTLTDVKNGICPRCGGKLVIREGRNGRFYGCSNYPKCKFTKNIDR